MTSTETRTVQELLRWGSKAIFLVTETEVATGVRDLFLQAADRIDALEKALSASEGYLLNAKIDLETGAPKTTAIRTIDGGLKIVRAALSPPSDNSDAQASMK